jgi:hypothetical protein
VNWNHLKVIQETPEKDTGKAWSNILQKSDISDTVGCDNVKVQNIQYGKKHYMYHKLYLQKSCSSTYHRDMVCLRYIIVNTLH